MPVVNYGDSFALFRLPELESWAHSRARPGILHLLSVKIVLGQGMTQYSVFAPEKAIKIFRSTLAKENNEVRERGAVLLN